MDLLLLCIGALLTTRFSLASSSPSAGAIYFASNVKSLHVGEEVDYQMRSAAEFSSHLLSSVKAAGLAGSPLPQALLVLVSETSTTSEYPAAISSSDEGGSVATESKAHHLADIKEVIDLASSSTVFTSVGHSCSAENIKDALISHAASDQMLVSDVRMGGSCGKDNGEDLKTFLHSWELEAANGRHRPGMALLVYCLPAAREQSSNPVDTPGANFLKAYLTLQNTTKSFATLLVPEAAPAGRATCSRSLAQALPPPGANGTCDATCMTKATLLEASFVAIVILIALVAGISCLVDLDTPTRFETDRESS